MTNFSSPLIVGIGASAGGLEAFTQLLAALGEERRLAIVFVQHLQADGKTLLADLLTSATDLPVEMLSGRTKASQGTVYICPPRGVLDVTGGQLIVQRTKSDEPPSLVIDRFFHALADSQSERSAAVVLSGAGTDGTLGLKAISDAGGLTFAQNADTAKFDSMPRNAATTGVADYVLPPKGIAEELIRFADYHERLLSTERSPNQQEQLEAAIPLISAELLKQTDHNFLHYKTSTLSRRINRRMQVLKLHRVEEYVARVQRDPNEAQDLFRELLIGVTAFFRDPDAFETLADNILPKLFEHRREDEPVRIWCPGCATGEEPYTIAILCAELLEKHSDICQSSETTKTGSLSKSATVQIFASDIDERALAIARSGTYPSGIADHVPPELLHKYFTRRGNRFQISPKIREMVLFSPHNLISDPPFSRQDLICCRNLLIYLGPHLQKKLIPLFHYALRPGGYLFLGPSESIAQHTELFRRVDAKHRISQRKGTAVRRTTPLSIVGQGVSSTRVMPADTDSEQQADVVQIMQRIVLDEFAPKSVVVDEEAQIICSSSDLSRYLTTGEGTFQNNVIKMARRGLRIGLRAVLTDAKKKRRRMTHENLSVQTDQGKQRVMITVQPMMRLGEDSGLFMVVFHDVGLPMNVETDEDPIEIGLARGSLDRQADAMIEQLERELETTRDDLEKSMQEMEAANEELKSSNEELLSMNEELQSANEELETSKEEIRAGSDALSRVNSDLENLLRSSQIATVFLDEELCIRSFTPAVADIYELIATDVGRPLSMFVPKVKNLPPLQIPDRLNTDVGEVPTATNRDAGTLVSMTQAASHIVEAHDGRFYARKVLPYMTSDDRRDGFVVTFSDVTELKHSELQLEASQRQLRTFADTVPPLMAIIDNDERFLFVNRAYADRWQRPAEDIIGRRIDEIVSKEAHASIAPHMAKAIAGEKVTYELVLPGPVSGESRYEEVVYVPQLKDDGQVEVIHVIVIDVTQIKRSQNQLADKNSRLNLTLEAGKMGSWDLIIDTGELIWDETNHRLFGSDPSQSMNNAKTLELIHPDDRAEIQRRLEACLQNRADFEYEFRVIGPGLADESGQLRWLAGRGKVVANEDGRPIRMIGVNWDITEQKRNEAELIAAEKFSRTVLESSPDCVKVLDGECCLQTMNATGMCQMDIDDFAPFKGQPWWSLWPEDNQQLVKDAIDQVKENGEGRFQAFCPTVKGTPKWWDVIVTPVRSNQDQIETFVSVSRDITEQRKWTAELADREAHARRIIDNTVGFIGVLDPSGTMIECNARAIEITGQTREDLIGTDFPETYWWNFDPEVQNQLRGIIARVQQGEAVREDIRYQSSQGEIRAVDFMLSPILDENGNVQFMIPSGLDIHDRLVAERKLARAKKQLDSSMADANIAPWNWSIETNKIRPNAMINAMFGFDADHPTTVQEFLSRIEASDRERVAAAVNDSLANRTDYFQEFAIRLPDNEIRWVRSQARVQVTEAGQIEDFYGITSDITDDRRREQNAKFRAELLDKLSRLSNPEDMKRLVVREIGEYFGASRCYLSQHHLKEKLAEILVEYHSDELKPIVGHYRLEDFLTDDEIASQAFGVPLRFDDIRQTDRPAKQIARIEALQLIALAEGMFEPFADPQRKLFVAMPQPRKWREDEIEFLALLSESVYQKIERAEHESAIEDSRGRLQLGMEISQFALAELDYRNDTIAMSPEAARMYAVGDAAVTITRDQLHATFHPSDRDWLLARIDECLDPDGQGTLNCEHRVVLPDGSERWLDVRKKTRFARVKNKSGKGVRRPISGTLVAVDITDRKQDELELSESRQRLALAMEAANMGSFWWEPETDLADWDAQWIAAMGVADDAEKVGKTFFELVHPADQAELDAATPQPSDQPQPYHAEYRVIRPDGEVRWFAGNGQMLPAKNGRPARLVGLNWDITDVRNATEQIRRAEERLRLAMGAAKLSLWEWDIATDEIVWANDLYLRQQRTPTQTFGKVEDFIAVVHPDDREMVQSRINETLEDGTPYRAEFRMRRADETYRWVLSMAHLSINDSGSPVRLVGVEMDVTARHEYEEELQKARLQAEAANASKSAFVANMSHEIRTPMTAILGYADLLAEHIHSDDAKKHLTTIQRNGEYLLEIINDILDLSKIEAGKLDIDQERFEPVRVIEDVRSIMEVRATESGLILEVEYDGKLPHVIESDAKRLKQILINLVGNAIKFTRKGRVRVRVRYESETSRPQSGGRLHFDVIDTGIGMNEMQQRKLFRPFSQGDNSVSRHFGGTGLGLAISRRLAKMLGGDVSASSTEGVGSTFTVSISTGELKNIELVDYSDAESYSLKALVSGSEKEKPEAKTRRLKDEDKPLRNIRVLAVDDRRDIRFLSKLLLTKAGATVDECEDGLLAVEHITDRIDTDSNPDLILLDMQMPNLDGYETARALRKLGYAGPIIALTADAMQGDMNGCLEAGCNDYLSKPIDTELLVSKVAELASAKKSQRSI